VSNLVSRPARLSPPRCAIIVVVGALALGALLAPAASVAAPAVTIATLSADVWPEHDDPRVLIIYRGTLSADAPLPYPLSFAIPVARRCTPPPTGATGNCSPHSPRRVGTATRRG